MIYLDYQATTPLAPEARAAMLPWLAGPDDDAGYANPASSYRSGREASVAVDMARDQVAALLPRGGKVYFTSGATEAINWALIAGSRINPGGCAGLTIEHAATVQCLEHLGGAELAVDASGIALVPDATALPEGGVLAVMLVNNEVGTIQPVADYAAGAKQRGNLVLCDAVQAFGRMTIPDGPDLIAVSAHKIHGPKGIGALWVRDGVKLPPLLVGGGQEQGMRAGTVSPALCAGFGAAAELAASRMDADATHVERLWDIAVEEMHGWTINGSATRRYKGNLNIRRDRVNGPRLLSDVRNVAFSLGSACASGSGRTSHVLRAMGVSDSDARSSVRFGWGRYTTEEALREGLGAIKAAARLQGVG